jgi:hypothetical protein
MALVRLAAAGTRGFLVSPARKRAKARIAPACSGFAPAPPTQGREPDHVIAVPLQIAACCDTVELANTCRSMLLEDQAVSLCVRADENLDTDEIDGSEEK